MLLVGGVFTVRDTQFVQNMPAVSRIANVSLEEATVQSRLLYIWPIALGGAMEKPVTGWGQENFSYIFNEHYPSQMYNQEQWFDRAHNQFLDWLVAGGVPAFLLYVLLFFLMVWIILRSDKLLVPEKGILLGLLAAYAFNNSFVFDNLMSAVYFYILLAYVHGLSAEPLPRRIFLSKPISDHGIAIAAPIVAVVILAGMWMFNAQGIARARTIIDAISSVDRKTGEEQTPKERLEYFRRTLEQGRLGQQEVVEQLYQYSSGLGGSSLAPEVKEEAYALAKSAGEEMLAVRPSDARLESFTGIFHAQYGEYGEALEHLERADELSPNKQSILFQLGEVQLRSGNTEEAIATYKRAFELVPEFDTARMMYAAALYYAGRITEADQLLEDRFGATIFDNDQLVQIYSSMGLEDRVVEIWKLRVEKDPENTDTYLGLASAYFAVGDVSSTIATLRKVAQINPATAAQVEQLISQIQSGALQVQQ
jgi:Flp pilus assembly protein TadD